MNGATRRNSSLDNPTHVGTHAVWADQRLGRLTRALCGRLVLKSEVSDVNPTCPDCLRALDDLDAGRLPARPGARHE